MATAEQATARRPAIRSLADIERIEREPYDTAVPLTSTHDIFVRSARLFGDRPAITFLPSADPNDPPVVVSYRDLLSRITAAANLFDSLGVGPQDAVALLLPPVPEAHFALWGAQAAGRACPINFLLNAEPIATLVTAAKAKVLVALGPQDGFDIWPKVEEIRRRAPGLGTVLHVGAAAPGAGSFVELLAATPGDRLRFARSIGRGDVAAYFQTGGTTGAPKLAQHTHGNEVHTGWFAGLYYDIGPEDVLINGLPLFHVAGSLVCGASSFVAGTNMVLPTALGMRNRAFIANHWRFVEKLRATVVGGVPTVLAALLDQPVGPSDIGSARLALTGGSPLPDPLAAAFEERFRIPVRNIFGMTECAGLISIMPAAAPRVPGSCGWRLPYSEVRAVAVSSGKPLLDEPCPPGQPGVIVLRGPHVGPGYTDPARNQGTLEGGWLISGDLGHLDPAGQIHVTGRAKDVIIRGGHNIDPAMIEEAVLGHPAVQMCAAVGEPDAYAGELPVVFVVLRPGATATPEAIIAETAPRIPERAAVPKRCTILETLPLTAVGKVYKPALRAMATERALREALAPLELGGARCAVAACETPGGLSARITIAGAGDRDRLDADLRRRLGPLAVGYDIVWE